MYSLYGGGQMNSSAYIYTDAGIFCLARFLIIKQVYKNLKTKQIYRWLLNVWGPGPLQVLEWRRQDERLDVSRCQRERADVICSQATQAVDALELLWFKVMLTETCWRNNINTLINQQLGTFLLCIWAERTCAKCGMASGCCKLKGLSLCFCHIFLAVVPELLKWQRFTRLCK